MTTPISRRAALQHRIATDAYPNANRPPTAATDPSSTPLERLTAEAAWLQQLGADWTDLLLAAVIDGDPEGFDDIRDTLNLINTAATDIAAELHELGAHQAADGATSWCLDIAPNQAADAVASWRVRVSDGPDWHL